MTQQNVRVGVGCFVFNEKGQFLILERCGAHGNATWGLAGGHQEWFETPEQTAARETLEETGIAVRTDDIVRLGFTNDIMVEDGKHYVTLFMGCRLPPGTVPENTEPHKCTNIEWSEGPSGRIFFSPLQNFLDMQPDPYGLYLSLMHKAEAA